MHLEFILDKGLKEDLVYFCLMQFIFPALLSITPFPQIWQPDLLNLQCLYYLKNVCVCVVVSWEIGSWESWENLPPC